MNRYKLKAIVEFVRGQASTLVDPVGRRIDVDQLLTCLGLDKLLSDFEQRIVKRELFEIAEAESFVDQLRLSVQR